MSDTPDESLLEFPCRFPIKMMGRKDDGFRKIAIDLVEKHAGTIADGDISEAPSSKGNFVSITVTIMATSREQLDDIYHELTASEHILVAL
jgi:putative lipoic acid-binding regulatory protein